MTGRLYQHPKTGKWKVILELGKDATGKRQSPWKQFDTKKEAKAYLAQAVADMERGAFCAPSTLTLADWLERWLVDYAPQGAQETTLAHYRLTIDKHIVPAMGDFPIQKLSPLVIQGYVTAWKEYLAASSIRYILTILGSSLKHAKMAGLVATNPVESVLKPKLPSKQQRALSVEESQKLLEAARGTKMYIPCLLALSAGLRRGEILGLKWSDIEGNVIHVQRSVAVGVVKTPKTRTSVRSITVPSSVIRELAKHKAIQTENRVANGKRWKDENWVLTREDGAHWEPNDISCTFHRLVKSMGMVGVKFHDLRKTHATLLFESGEVNVKAVQDRMGHIDSQTTIAIYTAALPQSDQRLADTTEQLLVSMGVGV